MRAVSHPHIIRYLGTQIRGQTLNILMEYARGGSLRSMLQRDGALGERTLRLYTLQLLSGLTCLHHCGIAHRDIKSANVLLCDSGLMLADFGASKRLTSASLVSGLKGTPHWMAPEVIRAQQTTSGWIQADVWSVGCTVLEMATGKQPWSQFPNPMTAMFHIAGGKSKPHIPPSVLPAARDFIDACLKLDPDDRPNAADLMDHPLVGDLARSMRSMGVDVQQLTPLKGDPTLRAGLGLSPPKRQSVHPPSVLPDAAAAVQQSIFLSPAALSAAPRATQAAEAALPEAGLSGSFGGDGFWGAMEAASAAAAASYAHDVRARAVEESKGASAEAGRARRRRRRARRARSASQQLAATATCRWRVA